MSETEMPAAAVTQQSVERVADTPPVRCRIKDLSVGDQILVPGYDRPQAVRSAFKVGKGPDAGKLEVDLLGEDGFGETVRFHPEEEVTVVAKNAGRAKPAAKQAKKTGAKGKAEAKKGAAKPASAGDKAEPKAKPDKATKAKKKADAGDKKMSAIDAAARVLGETGQPMNTKEMIEHMAQKGYWTSPGGKTPHATLYAAILREINHKGKESRFEKVEAGKFAATNKA
jgi:hypothetical protein